MSPSVYQPAVDSGKSDVGHFAEVRETLIQPGDGQVTHLAGDELVPRAEGDGGCRGRNLRDALVDYIRITADHVGSVVLHGRHPQRLAELVDAGLQVRQSLVVELELRSPTIGRVDGVNQVHEVLITDAVRASVANNTVVQAGASRRDRNCAGGCDGGDEAERRVGAGTLRQVVFVTTSQTGGECFLQEGFETERGILHQFQRYTDEARAALVRAERHLRGQ